MRDEQKEMQEILNDANKVQDILSKNKITGKEFLHSIPVLMSEFYPDKQIMLNTFEILVKESVLMHDILYKK